MTAEGFTLSGAATILLVDLGISLPNVLGRAGLPQTLLTEAAPTVTVERYYALWRALVEEAADPLLPLRIAAALSAESFDPPVFAALCSPDLTLAATRVARHKRLIGPLQLSVTTSTTRTTIETQWPDGPAPPEALVLTELLFWVALVRLATRAAVRPVQVRAPLRPAEPSAYQEYLGVPIGAGDVPSITFAAEDAGRPFLTANARMWDFFEPELRRRLADLDSVSSSMTELVRAALLRLLPAGSPTTAAVARELAVSTRTLQRRLLIEATTFQAVLRETRESLARHYLNTARLRTAEIAYLLGYEDTNSFYRAFHAWTGQTPDQARQPAR